MRFLPGQHLRRQGDIRAVREHGQRFDCRAFTVWWKSRAPQTVPAAGAENTPAEPLASPSSWPRVCVIASTAAVGRAVMRNRAKRRLREVFRRHQTHLPPHTDLLLIARRAATTWPMSDLEQRFLEACRNVRGAVAADPGL